MVLTIPGLYIKNLEKVHVCEGLWIQDIRYE